jgi:hypothetical protein
VHPYRRERRSTVANPLIDMYEVAMVSSADIVEMRS